VHVTYDDEAYTDVMVGTGHGPATITGTAYHLYWDATTRSWTPADHLHIGDHLQTSNGGVVTIQSLHDYTTRMVTYNLTIDNLHTYYVLAGIVPVLVHNSNNCGPAYENPGHHDPAGGPNPYNPAKGLLPADAEEQFANSVQVGKVRWTKIGSGKKSVYYRYSQHGDDVWHFSGSSNGVTNSGAPVAIPLDDIPISVRRG
jgi:hypothetical protein